MSKNIISCNKVSDLKVNVSRPNNNDCWNVALALGCNLPYDKVRKDFEKRGWICRKGGAYTRPIINYLEEHNYERYKTPCKTLKSLAEDTKFTNYEYVVIVSAHVVYIVKGKIYDSNKSVLKRIEYVGRRKISSRRKYIHEVML